MKSAIAIVIAAVLLCGTIAWAVVYTNDQHCRQNVVINWVNRFENPIYDSLNGTIDNRRFSFGDVGLNVVHKGDLATMYNRSVDHICKAARGW